MLKNKNTVIDELKKKVEHLITQYITSLERNRALQDENKVVRAKLEEVKHENRELKDKIKTLKAAKGFSEGEYSADAKNKINRLVREIDKCIALLNN